MPITDLTSRHRELGRLKFGEDAGDRPRTLDTWRLTSPHRDLLEAAALVYGGDVGESGEGHELITDTDELTVYLPRQDIAAGQWFELWTAGGLQRRCDGEHLAPENYGDPTDSTGPCVCNPDARECKPTTVLRVVLPELPDLGVWRLTTRSYYAAAELPQAAALLFATSTAPLVPAVLALDARKTKRAGERTKRYTVPILRTTSTLAELVAGPAVPQLPAGPREHVGTFGGVPVDTDTAALNPYIAAEDALSDLAQSTRAPESDETPPQAPDTPEPPIPSEWDALAAFLVGFHPSKLGHNTGELIEKLEELEARMLTVGLWHAVDGTPPLDVSAGRHFGDGTADTYWRDDVYKTDRLRAFAQKAAMAAHTATSETRLGARALTKAEAEAEADEEAE